MLKVLEDKDQIQRAETQLLCRLKSRSEKQGIISVRHRGGSQRLNANWSKQLDIWWTTKDNRNRFWNAFGTGEPKWNSSASHRIKCEINPPKVGIDRRIAGVFAKDNEGNIHFLHRGKLGGGKPGVNKELFEQHFTGSWEEVEDGTKLALVASFNDPRFIEQIADFVHEVERIKLLAFRKT